MHSVAYKIDNVFLFNVCRRFFILVTFSGVLTFLTSFFQCLTSVVIRIESVLNRQNFYNK